MVKLILKNVFWGQGPYFRQKSILCWMCITLLQKWGHASRGTVVRRIFSYFIIIVQLFFLRSSLHTSERKFGFFWHISGRMFTAAVKLWKTPLFLGRIVALLCTHKYKNISSFNETKWPWKSAVWIWCISIQFDKINRKKCIKQTRIICRTLNS